MKSLSSVFKIISVILIIGCIVSCSKSNTPQKPPRGYLNETFLKISYATKLLKLIDTEPEVPKELQVFERLEYKNIDSISLQLDIYKQREQKEPIQKSILMQDSQ